MINSSIPYINSFPANGESPTVSPSISPPGSPKRRRHNRNSAISMKSLLPLLNRHQIVSQGVPKNETEVEIAHLASTLDNSSLPQGSAVLRIPETHLFSLLLYILQKPIRNESDLILIRYYLSNFPTLTTALSLKKSFTDPFEILHKLAVFIQGESFERNRIVCMNGEVGDKFYLIFKGKVSVLVPNPYQEELTPIEYLNHLYALKRLREYDLMNRTIDANREKYMTIEILNLASEEHDCYNITRGEVVNEDEYLERLKPIKGVKEVKRKSIISPKELNEQIISLLDNNESNEEGNSPISPIIGGKENNEIENDKTMKFTLYSYHKICSLGAGKSFGDIALSKDISNRTATIIASEDSFLGSLHKDVYQICIKDAQEKHRKQNIEYVLSQKMFSNFNADIFERYYFNFFKSVHAGRGHYLFSQGSKPTEVYFIFDGEVSFQSKMSLSFCTDIVSSLKERTNSVLNPLPEAKIKKLNTMHQKMDKFYKDSKMIKIMIVKNKDVVGLDDQLYNGEYFTSAIVTSDSCDYYSIEKGFFEKMIKNEIRIRDNYNELIKEKYEMMVKRLNGIKYSSIQQFYQSLIKLEENYPLIENESVRKSASLLSIKFKLNKNFKINATTTKDITTTLSTEITSPYLTERNSLNISMQKRKRNIKKIKEMFTLNIKNSLQSKDFEKKAKQLYYDNANPPLNGASKRTNLICNNIVNKIVSKDRKYNTINTSFNHIDFLAMDNYIKKIDTYNQPLPNKQLKGSVYKIKRKKILKKIILNE